MIIARNLFRGVEVLANRTPYELNACVFLAAQTLECALKAWVWESRRARTGVEGEVRGHNLVALWAEAAESAFELRIAPEPPDWCVTLNSGHSSPYRFRYLTDVDGLSSPPPALMTSALRTLLAQIADALHERQKNKAIESAGG